MHINVQWGSTATSTLNIPRSKETCHQIFVHLQWNPRQWYAQSNRLFNINLPTSTLIKASHQPPHNPLVPLHKNSNANDGHLTSPTQR